MVNELIPGVYLHFKGKFYSVYGVVDDLVLYRALYGEMGLWVRPYEMFVEEKESGVPRFKFILASDPLPLMEVSDFRFGDVKVVGVATHSENRKPFLVCRNFEERFFLREIDLENMI